MQRNRRAAAVLVPFLVLFLTGSCTSEDPPVADPTPSPSPTSEPSCSLSGMDVPADVDAFRPAVAMKVENNPAAYPLSGLEDAEIVYEEVVEGGVTRFMAIYHCTDSKKVGSIRSSRSVDAAVLGPITKILGAAGSNDIVKRILQRAGIIMIDENNTKVFRRIARDGVSFEHTLYGDTVKLRASGRKQFSDPPPEDLYEFGEPSAGGKPARKVTLTYSSATTVDYVYKNGKYKRFDYGGPLETEGGDQIAVDNVIVQLHTVKYSDRLVDIMGNRSFEIADPTGSGPALLFRDGRVWQGRWERSTLSEPFRFVLRSGETMVLESGTTWIHLVPNKKGALKGKVRFKK